MSRRLCTDGGSDRNRVDQSYEVSYDLDEDELPSTVIVRSVASLTDTSPLDLNPLYNVIDPNHLDKLFQNHDESTVQAEITFTYNGCEVTITGDKLYVRTVNDLT